MGYFNEYSDLNLVLITKDKTQKLVKIFEDQRFSVNIITKKQLQPAFAMELKKNSKSLARKIETGIILLNQTELATSSKLLAQEYLRAKFSELTKEEIELHQNNLLKKYHDFQTSALTKDINFNFLYYHFLQEAIFCYSQILSHEIFTPKFYPKIIISSDFNQKNKIPEFPDFLFKGIIFHAFEIEENEEKLIVAENILAYIKDKINRKNLL